MIPATTLCTLGSPCWTLALSKRCALPQNLHILSGLVSGSRSQWFFDLSESRRLDGGCLSFTLCTSSFWAPDIVFNCTFVASLLLHRSIQCLQGEFPFLEKPFPCLLVFNAQYDPVANDRVVHAIAEIACLGERAESGDISINRFVFFLVS